MSLDPRYAGYALSFLGAALFSTKAIFVKLAFADRVDAALMVAWRMIFALPFYLAIGAWAVSERGAAGAPPPEPVLFTLKKERRRGDSGPLQRVVSHRKSIWR